MIKTVLIIEQIFAALIFGAATAGIGLFLLATYQRENSWETGMLAAFVTILLYWLGSSTGVVIVAKQSSEKGSIISALLTSLVLLYIFRLQIFAGYVEILKSSGVLTRLSIVGLLFISVPVVASIIGYHLPGTIKTLFRKHETH